MIPSSTFGVEADDPEWVAITTYLAEHGLVEIKGAARLDSGSIVITAKISAAGLDFLQDDGGLTAILGVVTIKFQAKTLRARWSGRRSKTGRWRWS